MTMTLTEFLLTRIAEDEAKALNDARWKWRGPSKSGEPQVVGVLFESSHVAITWVEMVDRTPVDGKSHTFGEETFSETLTYDEFDKRVRHLMDKRVLAECEAKRQIVAEHAPSEDYPKDCRTCAQWWGDWDHSPPPGVPSPCPTLRFLVLPYADHPDYDQAWRP
jgi:hypothetical protein